MRDTLGHGAFSSVYLGLKWQTDIPVAITMRLGRFAAGPVVAQRFIRQAKAGT